ncbi:L,D-transpeptidase family protein [Endozoicomonas sp. G2_2]|uniref:L,D-transpeptidase family protein n=1 Tax=Endozoicomonas sp. G2_2 TaxID=2821092 RepID=UPI001AD95FDF|nr:L,D-transpeptidase family protein [Endozoicomonas sp. G2_2]MBO9469918.1 L,D-transpeptidase family protein [Endozoicomonas sp. G2_2]
MKRAIPLLLLLAGCGLWPVLAASAGTETADSTVSERVHSNAESQLLAVLNLAQQGEYDTAINDLSDLIEARPNFRLAQLVYGELMVARSGRSIDPAISEKMRDQRDALLDEAKTRWAHRVSAATDGKVPDVILQMAPEYEHAIVVDLSNNRLYLFANDQGVPRLISDFYTTIGRGGAGKQVEGDMRTPIGIYHITRYINDNGLPELYGVGALPVNYPNALDRARGRTGYGIWLHGVPRTTYSRTPRASEGCVVIANDDFESIRDHVDVGTTPVIMTTGIDWVPAADVEAQRTALLSAVESWRHSWQAIDTKSYLTYYAPDFVSDDGRDKAAFATYKKQINASKTNITVDLSDISIFRYPGEDRMMKVTFNQNYTSNNYHAEDRKTQYWQQNDDGQWQIVLETEKD